MFYTWIFHNLMAIFVIYTLFKLIFILPPSFDATFPPSLFSAAIYPPIRE